MKAQNYGRIVYTASSTGLFGTSMVGGYGAAKAGLAGLMMVAAHEGAEHGIVCNALMPNAASRMALQAAADWQAARMTRDLSMPPEIGNSMNVEFNTPLAVWLASAECTATRGLYSQCLGRQAQVFVGVTHGWQAQRQSAPSVEEIAANWGRITDAAAGYDVPGSPNEELGLVLSHSLPAG